MQQRKVQHIKVYKERCITPVPDSLSHPIPTYSGPFQPQYKILSVCLSATKSKVKPNKFCSQTFEREKDAPEKSLQIKNDDLSTCFNCLNIRGILRQQINFASYFGLELGWVKVIWLRGANNTPEADLNLLTLRSVLGVLGVFLAKWHVCSPPHSNFQPKIWSLKQSILFGEGSLLLLKFIQNSDQCKSDWQIANSALQPRKVLAGKIVFVAFLKLKKRVLKMQESTLRAFFHFWNQEQA